MKKSLFLLVFMVCAFSLVAQTTRSLNNVPKVERQDLSSDYNFSEITPKVATNLSVAISDPGKGFNTFNSAKLLQEIGRASCRERV